MEAGVRQLEREIGAVCRGKAVEYAEARDADGLDQYDPVVRLDDLERILGVEKVEPEVSDAEGQPGVATGLAYRGSGNGGASFDPLRRRATDARRQASCTSSRRRTPAAVAST